MKVNIKFPWMSLIVVVLLLGTFPFILTLLFCETQNTGVLTAYVLLLLAHVSVGWSCVNDFRVWWRWRKEGKST